jgi:hypothetical protein
MAIGPVHIFRIAAGHIVNARGNGTHQVKKLYRGSFLKGYGSHIPVVPELFVGDGVFIPDLTNGALVQADFIHIDTGKSQVLVLDLKSGTKQIHHQAVRGSPVAFHRETDQGQLTGFQRVQGLFMAVQIVEPPFFPMKLFRTTTLAY